MRTLITSGGNLAPIVHRLLKQRGHAIRVLRRRPDPAYGEDCVIGDITVMDDVLRAMDGCDRVVHTAVCNNDDLSIERYPQFVQTNVTGTFNVMQAAMKLATPRVVCASTSMVLGFQRWWQTPPPDGRAVRIGDDRPHDPTCIYSLTKSLAEQATDFFRNHHHVNVVNLRFGWLAPLRRYAEWPVLYRALAFCFHPEDAAAGVLAAMDSTRQGNYLIAGELPWTDADAARLWSDPRGLLAERFPAELAYLERAGCPIIPIGSWLDCSAAKRDLGYQPRHDFRWFVRQHEAGAFQSLAAAAPGH